MPRGTRGRKVPRGRQSSRGQRSNSITTRPIVSEVVKENSFTHTEEDLEHVCRLCLVRGGPTMEHIFCKSGVSSIAAQITWVTQLEMRKDEPLPSRICQQCIFRLTLSQNFKEQCVSSDKTLRDLYLKKPKRPASVRQKPAEAASSSPEIEEDTAHVHTSYTLKVEPLSPCSSPEGGDGGDVDFKIEIVEHGVDEPAPGSDSSARSTKQRAKGSKPPHVCEVCHRTYPTWDQLRRHRVYHSDKRLPCPECGRAFVRRAQLHRHMRTHSGERPYACARCDKRFAARTTLEVHARSHLGVKPFACPVCDKTFGHGSTLVTHMRAHSGDRPYACARCPMTFTAKSPLDKHLRTHTGFKPHKCPDCPLTFTLPSSLRTHSRTHTGERPFPCPHCDKCFSQPGGLKNHVRIHTGSKPYECKICGKSYRQQGAYGIHMRTHANVRPYSCDVCSKSFNVKKTLARHILVHTGEKTFECAVCQQAFSREDGLANHMLIHNNERPFECVTCKKSFRQKVALALHMRCHTGERPYKCAYCGMRFAQKGTMTTHMRVHTGERPFACSQCKKTFAQLGNLLYHKKRHHPSGEEAKGVEAVRGILDQSEEEDCEETEASEEGLSGKTSHHCELCSKTFLKLKTLIWHVEHSHTYADEIPQGRKKETRRGGNRKKPIVSERPASRTESAEEIIATEAHVSISTAHIKTEVEIEMDEETASVNGENVHDSQDTVGTNVAGAVEPGVTEICGTETVDTLKIRSTPTPLEDVEADRTLGTGDTFLTSGLNSLAKASDECVEAIVSSTSFVKSVDTKMPNTSRCEEGENTSNAELIESTPTLTNMTETTTSNSEHNSFHTRFIADNLNGASSTGETSSDRLEVVNTDVTEMETENTSFGDTLNENTSNSTGTYLHA